MIQDSIKLGAKKPQGKSLSCAKLRGFFNGGACKTQVSPIRAVDRLRDVRKYAVNPRSAQTVDDISCAEYRLVLGSGHSRSVRSSRYFPARQHLILQTICRQRLRKGFQKQWCGNLTGKIGWYLRMPLESLGNKRQGVDRVQILLLQTNCLFLESLFLRC